MSVYLIMDYLLYWSNGVGFIDDAEFSDSNCVTGRNFNRKYIETLRHNFDTSHRGGWFDPLLFHVGFLVKKL